MRRLLVLAVVVVAAAAVSGAAAETTVTDEDVPAIFIPVCVDGVIAEGASGIVHEHTVTTSVTNGNRLIFRVVFKQQGQLTGGLTGNTYQYTLSNPFMLTLSPTDGNPQAKQTGFLKSNIVGPKGNRTVVTSLFTALINGNGEVVFVVEEPLTTECK